MPRCSHVTPVAPPGATNPPPPTPTPTSKQTSGNTTASNANSAKSLLKKEKAAQVLKDRDRARENGISATSTSTPKSTSPPKSTSASKSAPAPKGTPAKAAVASKSGPGAGTPKPKKVNKMPGKLKIRGPDAVRKQKERKPGAIGLWKEGAQERDTSTEGTPVVESRNGTNGPATASGDTPKDARAGATEHAELDAGKAEKRKKASRDETNTIYCKHCRRSVGREESAEHIRGCVAKKQEKQRRKKEAKEAKDLALRRERGEDVDDVAGRKGGKGAVVDGDGAKKGKKRKAGDGDGIQGPNKKKKKDEMKAKAKPKGPVDVERQCGVRLPNGGFCARSLTCKSHSMGLKRAVGGRSLPYDMLLAQYQKKNQAKQQRKFTSAFLSSPLRCMPLGDEY